MKLVCSEGCWSELKNEEKVRIESVGVVLGGSLFSFCYRCLR